MIPSALAAARRRLLSSAAAPSLPAGLDIIVPVCNAGRWIGIILDGYAELGVAPLFILDRRSADDTRAQLVERRARIMTGSGAHPRVESLLLDVVPRLRSRWLLRFDDDELPSRALLDWVRARLGDLERPVVGFPRQWIARCARTGDIVASHCAGPCAEAGGSAPDDRQYRLFQPRFVTLVDDLHSPGFVLPKAAEAPEEAVIHHFDWLVRDRAGRAAKLAGYERQAPGCGTRFAGYYLPEDRPAAFYDFTPVADPMALRAAARLAPR